MKHIFALMRRAVDGLIEYRFMLSVGLAAAAGILLCAYFPWPESDPLLRLVSVEHPSLYMAAADGYQLFLFTTPFLLFSMIFSLLYVHAYRQRTEAITGTLPPYPQPQHRQQLSLILGEVHQQLNPLPSVVPRWLSIPERGLYTGMAVIGSTGSGKTWALVIPAMRQLFGYRAADPEKKLSGVVLEVKGDLCGHLRSLLESCGRADDFIDVSLEGPIRYNPLNNSLDPYAQAFSIASVIISIWGAGKEPFWQQSYTDLVRYVIMLHRVRDGYVTLLDIFRTVISAGKLEDILIETGSRFSGVVYVGLSQQVYQANTSLLAPFSFELNARTNQYMTPWSRELEQLLVEHTACEATVYRRKPYDPAQRDRWHSIHYWYWEHWKFFRSEVKTSIVQGIEVFLSLFETDPDVRRVFCPPKELYAGHACPSDAHGKVLPQFEELIEQGKIVGLDFPVALNPALAKVIGTMMKVDYQRAVLLRIPKMEANPQKHFRPTVFLCDEYQNFATVGGNNPTGDERFLSISRQPKCIPIVATQSISSLKDALPNEGVKTLLQAFRTKVFLTTTDPDTARYASELCGKADKTRISYTVSESSSNANVGWLSGRTSSSKGSVSASKQYQKHKEPLFEEKVFLDLKNAQAVAVVYDGVTPLPPTYCYLKPDFLPVSMSWFEQEKIGFDPERISA